MEATRLYLFLCPLVIFSIPHSSSIILEEQAQKQQVCPKPNSEYKFCQSSAQPTCNDPKPNYRTNNCLDGCFCKEGFVLNNKNDCIKFEDCKFDKVPALWWLPKACMKTCATKFLDVPYFCPCQDRKCDLGKMFDEISGKCVLTKECNTQNFLCPKNKEYKPCKNSIKSCLGYTGNISEAFYKQCLPKCYCKEGLVENLNDGTCVPPEDCPKIECPRNQTFSKSPPCKQSCKNYFQNIPTSGEPCSSGCGCSEGYTLNAKNQCILVHDCPEKEIVCGDNQYLAKWQIRKTCRDPKGLGFKTNGCFCTAGLVYDEDRRQCVHPGECPKSEAYIVCEAKMPNSEYMACQPADMQYCDGDNLTKLDACVPGCYCKPGFFLKKGKCVSHCNRECPSNSTYVGNNTLEYCGRTCSQMLLKDDTCIDTRDGYGCHCHENYVKNSLGLCILPKDCSPEEIQCPPKSTFFECNRNVIPSCQDDRVLKVKDVETVTCSWGCFCDEPFIKDKLSGTCVLPNECPLGEANTACKSKDRYSEYKTCTKSIQPSCTNRYPNTSKADCEQPGCQCISGTYLNSNDKCVLPEICDDEEETARSFEQCGSNSTYSSCASACPKTCANAYLPGPKSTCMACYEGCECKPGYLQTKAKNCVLQKDCPEAEIICPYDRVYKSCEHGVKTCQGKKESIEACIRGCFCGNNMVEDETGRCVFPSECPNSVENQGCLKQDANSYFKECQFVRRTCSDPDGRNRKAKCRRGCYCHDGYVFYKKVNKCVRVEMCSL